MLQLIIVHSLMNIFLMILHKILSFAIVYFCRLKLLEIKRIEIASLTIKRAYLRCFLIDF